MNIIVSKFAEIEFPSFDDVRLAEDACPDLQDCLEIDAAQVSLIRQHERSWRDGSLVLIDPRSVSAAHQYPSTAPGAGLGQTRNATLGAMFPRGTSPACPTPRDGGTPQPDCEPVTVCGATPVAFNTYLSADYPLTGVTLGVFVQGAEIEITAGRAKSFSPLWLFLSSRDTANGFVEVSGYLNTATVNGNPQLAGTNLSNRPLDSDLYRNIGPLRLDNWAAFSNTEPDVLMLSFAHVLGPAADVGFSGAFFGQASSVALPQ